MKKNLILAQTGEVAYRTASTDTAVSLGGIVRASELGMYIHSRGAKQAAFVVFDISWDPAKLIDFMAPMTLPIQIAIYHDLPSTLVAEFIDRCQKIFSSRHSFGEYPVRTASAGCPVEVDPQTTSRNEGVVIAVSPSEALAADLSDFMTRLERSENVGIFKEFDIQTSTGLSPHALAYYDLMMDYCALTVSLTPELTVIYDGHGCIQRQFPEKDKELVSLISIDPESMTPGPNDCSAMLARVYLEPPIRESLGGKEVRDFNYLSDILGFAHEQERENSAKAKELIDTLKKLQFKLEDIMNRCSGLVSNLQSHFQRYSRTVFHTPLVDALNRLQSVSNKLRFFGVLESDRNEGGRIHAVAELLTTEQHEAAKIISHQLEGTLLEGSRSYFILSNIETVRVNEDLGLLLSRQESFEPVDPGIEAAIKNFKSL